MEGRKGNANESFILCLVGLCIHFSGGLGHSRGFRT